MHIFRSEDIQNLDRDLHTLGLLTATLENAGRAVAHKVHELYPSGRILLLAGAGHNGADAVVAARHLYAMGRTIVLCSPTTAHTRHFQALCQQPVYDPSHLPEMLSHSDVIVDGLLGTGFIPPLRPETSELITAINHSQKPVCSIDIPSGMLANSSTLYPCVQAKHTLALLGYKPCMLFEPSKSACGTVHVLDIGIPETYKNRFGYGKMITTSEVKTRLPQRKSNAHKGSAGEVWLLGGREHMTGCMVLASKAALRMGAGYARVMSAVAIPNLPVECIVHAVQDIQFTGAVVLGMGMGKDAPNIAQHVLGQGVCCVVDADALSSDLQHLGHEHSIFTPHPLEAARMLGRTVPDIIKDPMQAARDLQQQFGGVMVLKTAPVVIAAAQTFWINSSGNAGMAVAGMGDVLSGTLGALLAQGLSAEDAALCGVYVHGLAGDLCFAQHGYGLTSQDVAEHLGAAWKSLV